MRRLGRHLIDSQEFRTTFYIIDHNRNPGCFRMTNLPFSDSAATDQGQRDTARVTPNREHPVVRPTFVRVAMPAYNEQGALPLLIPRIVQAMEESPWQYDILVVDDGSSDRTVEVVERLAADYPVRW